MAPKVDEAPTGRRSGGLKLLRPDVWRVDVEVPRKDGEPRRRISRTVTGTEEEAEAALEKLRQEVQAGLSKRKRKGKRGQRRQKGSGGITGRGHDKWLISLEGDADPVTGDRQRVTKMIHGSREEAEAELALMKIQLRSGKLPSGTRVRNVEAACKLYLEQVGTEKSTLRVDRSACTRICETRLVGGSTLGDVNLRDVDWKLVEYVFGVWGRKLKPSTASRYASTLSKVVEQVKREGWIHNNPVREARKPKVPSHRPDVPNRGDVELALAAARSTNLSTFAFVLAVASTGCRKSELLGLRVADLNLEERIVTIRGALADGGAGVGVYYKATKRDDWRDIPITDQLAEALTALLAERRERAGKAVSENTEAFVFSDSIEGSTWWRPDTTTQRWLAARGKNNVTFAMLRRFVATELLDVTDGDYRTVASITGNSEQTLRKWYDAGPNISKKKAVLSRAAL